MISDNKSGSDDFIAKLERYAPMRIRAGVLRRELKETAAGDVRRERIERELEQLNVSLENIELECSRFVPCGAPRDESYFESLRTYLRCRYIDSMTLEQTAELMCLSRDSIYRFKRKTERLLGITGKPTRRNID